MAICSSSFRLSHLANFPSEIDSKEQWDKNWTVDARVFGCLRRHNVGFLSSTRAGFLSISSKCKTIVSLSGTERIRFSLTRETRDSRVLHTSFSPNIDNGGGRMYSLRSSAGNGDIPPGGGGGGHGGGGGGSGGNGKDDHEEKEFGPLVKFVQVMKEAEACGVGLPPDMLEAAKTVGIRRVLLDRYFDLQGSSWPLGFAIRSCSLLRNRMLADPSFLFKVGTEIVIDSCCATFAEVQKRGKDFWSEFELYAADLLVGVVVDIALVGMLAPYTRFGAPTAAKGLLGHLQRASGALPSSVFEAERPGCRFTVQQRIATYFYKGLLYGAVGFTCGIIGQGIANLIMTAKRSIKKSEEDIPVPPLVESAALWGFFLGVSSNTRYQLINGMESLVEALPLAKRVPALSMAFTVGVRFANNIYGGMQFVDWAKWSGVQ
ncbi:protein RETICULATA-RELATED 1, chloroplastic-like isoform X3 [Macadamia integrifolia]|uniref:protein RETICULATA-RELATED 1, chloroplastic-like isoform X1 n=1 Tax=Macadamia integrifolia TaxID=60698 RepID=UPI001C4F02FE|nr:protein RETICULATA-RELATED 1, chloroplastic-like isoform X1 [Macadamia integrifolia]XP_042481152.1 protein RETICULATA-RELATED 1, chloroplastic-like isoform X2 [Macadamia integrifolia]XP_042481161.1 protein RETICULATA-RELATED 1, chloroplastic-like isoform X3 [Macadamia integrifolia]